MFKRLLPIATIAGALTVAMASSALAGGGGGGCGGGGGFGGPISGQDAFAGFSSVPVNSIETDVFLFASTGPTPTVFVNVTTFNNATGMVISSASGCGAAPSLQVASDLSSGTLGPTTVALFDNTMPSPTPVATVSASGSWTGVGPISRSISIQHFSSPGFNFTSHLNATSRSATATGSVTNGTTQYISTAANFAGLDNVKAGSVTITH